MARFLAATAVLVAFAAVSAATTAAQPPPPPPPDLQVIAAPNPVKFGEAVTISGQLNLMPVAGMTIELREDPFPFDTSTTVATAVTDVGGAYLFSRNPTVNTRYQTRQGATMSRTTTVGVRPVISLRVSNRRPAAARRVSFSGRVCPEQAGDSLAIQRRTAPKRWRTVRRATLADLAGRPCSTYTRRVRVRHDGVYRTFLAADADYAAGSSRKRRIDVH
jgi:hypothetical protein